MCVYAYCRQHRTASDLDRAHTMLERMRDELEQTHKEASLLQEKERQTVIKNKTLLGKLKTANEEVCYVLKTRGKQNIVLCRYSNGE